MWIRSQDKNCLVYTHELFIGRNNMVYGAYSSTVGDRGIAELGGYKTSERAIAVLDEIQTHLERAYDIGLRTYQMPIE